MVLPLFVPALLLVLQLGLVSAMLTSKPLWRWWKRAKRPKTKAGSRQNWWEKSNGWVAGDWLEKQSAASSYADRGAKKPVTPKQDERANTDTLEMTCLSPAFFLNLPDSQALMGGHGIPESGDDSDSETSNSRPSSCSLNSTCMIPGVWQAMTGELVGLTASEHPSFSKAVEGLVTGPAPDLGQGLPPGMSAATKAEPVPWLCGDQMPRPMDMQPSPGRSPALALATEELLRAIQASAMVTQQLYNFYNQLQRVELDQSRGAAGACGGTSAREPSLPATRTELQEQLCLPRAEANNDKVLNRPLDKRMGPVRRRSKELGRDTDSSSSVSLARTIPTASGGRRTVAKPRPQRRVPRRRARGRAAPRPCWVVRCLQKGYVCLKACWRRCCQLLRVCKCW